MRPQIRRSVELLGVARAALVSRRPSAVGYVDSGLWGAVLDGWKAQHELVNARLADEAASARLRLAERDALIALVRSEFGVEIDTGPKRSVGHVWLERGDGGDVCLIRKGTRFRRAADAAAMPAAKSCLYESTAPVLVPKSATLQEPTILIQSVTPGVEGNVVRDDTYGDFYTGFSIADTLSTPGWTLTLAVAAGGSAGISVEALRTFAGALAQGQYGATLGAIYAGALAGSGAEHVAVAEADGWVGLWAADVSWAWSAELDAAIMVSMDKTWRGFGVRIGQGRVKNLVAIVGLTAVLRDPSFLSSTEEISNNIRREVRAYFNDREDWYTWNLQGLRGAIMRADARLLRVVGITVRDRENVTIAEPARYLTPAENMPAATHLWVDDTNINIQFAGPTDPGS